MRGRACGVHSDTASHTTAATAPVRSPSERRRYSAPSRRRRSSASRIIRTWSRSLPSIISRTNTVGEGRPGCGRIRSLHRLMAKLRGGIDLGGTKVQAIVADERHDVVGQARVPTPTTGGAQAVVDALASALRGATDDADVEPKDLAGVGLGSPGDADDG